MKTVPTFTATIYVGRKHRSTGKVYPISRLRRACQKYVNGVGLCVTFTPTEFIYTKGGEPGVAVGLMNYPRFPSEYADLRRHAMKLAAILQEATKQLRVSVAFNSETVMLSIDASPLPIAPGSGNEVTGKDQ